MREGIQMPESPLERAKRLSREMVDVDELVGLDREPITPIKPHPKETIDGVHRT